MKFISHGAAQEVTGTCHELQIEHAPGKISRVLLDCGLFQGRREEAAQKNATFNFQVTDIDAVVLSHSHMDHVGRIPLLYKKGYRGPVYCTYASKDLAAVMLRDGGYIQEQDEEFFQKHLKDSMIAFDGPLYTQEDAAACMKLFRGENYGDWINVCPGLRVQLFDAGHIIGSAQLLMEVTEGGKTRHIGFSADLGRSELPIIRDPVPMPPVELLICESTYGNRRHEDIGEAKNHLQAAIVRTAERGGKIIIPAFSLERTQEIVYDLHVLWDAKKIPPVPIIIDSPLASSVTDVFMKHPECYDQEMFAQFLGRQHNPFQFSLVRYTDSVEESKALNGTPGPMIIMAASGMCEAGRIRHHLKNEIGNPKNTILAVGYMAENTLGRRVVDPTVGAIKIFDQMYPKKAEIVSIDAYSGHADMDDLDGYVAMIDGLKKVILVHGELEAMQPFAQRLNEKLGVEVLTPKREEEIIL
ncbi:MAG: MBL fold metallo-hydrolase [Candidatus Peribacteraceae bacterium]|nr:MBL fold metallo-hydrolase [Candidatus Peribacteraceae bacterium]